MTLFVDASALVAIIRDEPEAETLKNRLDGDPVRLTSAVAMWEAALAVGRAYAKGAERGLLEVERYCRSVSIVAVPVGEAEAAEAVRAHTRYGKRSGHRARLNIGDCFAYACAKTSRARLLYKGDDFVHTDLR